MPLLKETLDCVARVAAPVVEHERHRLMRFSTSEDPRLPAIEALTARFGSILNRNPMKSKKSLKRMTFGKGVPPLIDLRRKLPKRPRLADSLPGCPPAPRNCSPGEKETKERTAEIDMQFSM